MEPYHQISVLRKQKGLTQEELADQCNVTVRTIQRIETGETSPRAYTLKAIATALDIPFEHLVQQHTNAEIAEGPGTDVIITGKEDGRHFLKIICLSCFSYLLIPFIHFLVPVFILKKSKEQDAGITACAKKIIRVQLYWVIGLWLLLLATLAFNITMFAFYQKYQQVNYLLPFFVMYFINAIIISRQLFSIHKMDPTNYHSLANG